MLIPTKFAGLARMLCTPDLARANPVAVQTAWTEAKEMRGQQIDAAHLSRLEELPSHYPGRRPSDEAPFALVIDSSDPDPMPPAPALSEVEAARQRAEPRIFAAVARRMRLGGGDAA